MCVIDKLKKKMSWNVWNYWKEFDNSDWDLGRWINTWISKWKTMQTKSKAIVNSKKTKTQEKKKYNQIIRSQYTHLWEFVHACKGEQDMGSPES